MVLLIKTCFGNPHSGEAEKDVLLGWGCVFDTFFFFLLFGSCMKIVAHISGFKIFLQKRGEKRSEFRVEHEYTQMILDKTFMSICSLLLKRRQMYCLT